MPATSSTRGPHRGSATPSSRPSTSPKRSPDRKPSLEGYEEWRDARAAEQYEWSFAWGHFPRPGTGEALFRGWATEPDAGQDLRDTFSRTVQPSQLNTKERLARWFDSSSTTAAETAAGA